MLLLCKHSDLLCNKSDLLEIPVSENYSDKKNILIQCFKNFNSRSLQE